MHRTKYQYYQKKSRMRFLVLDKSNESGSHWVALTKVNNETYIYDSFGRKINK